MLFTSVLPFGSAALLLSLCCWGVGSLLVSSRSSVIAMLAGWSGFLFLCALAWILGFSAHAMRPVFWLFFLVGLWSLVRKRAWLPTAVAVLCTAAFVFLFGYPFLTQPQLLAYGAHGLDMWGYIDTAEWLQHHSIRTLPVIGVDAMRFNWTWKVLGTRERPLIYESLACLASATGLSVAQAYVAYPIALLSSLAMALSREPGIFRLKPRSAWLAVPVMVVLVFHPLMVLPWIAGYFGGSITAPFVALALAGAVVAGTESEKIEGLAFATLMLVLCGALYTAKLALVGAALGGAALVFFGGVILFRDGWRGWCARPVLVGAGLAALMVGGALFVLGDNQSVNVGEPQAPSVAWAHLLGMFGGSSPYAWLGYRRGELFDREVWANPVGLATLVATAALFLVVVWREWRTARDLRVLGVMALAAAALVMSITDEVTMAKTLALFGFALLVVLATSARALPHWTLAILAAAICVSPALRSAAEMQDIISGPYITCTEDNLPNILDGQDWRMLGYLAFREDRDGFNWAKYPRSFTSVTQFLPMPLREQLAAKYGMPKPQ